MLHGNLQPAAAADDLLQTVNYADVHRYRSSQLGSAIRGRGYLANSCPEHRSDARRTIQDVVEGAPQQLIESVAEQTATAVLQAHPAVLGIDVLVKKPQAPIDGNFDYVGVLLCAAR